MLNIFKLKLKKKYHNQGVNSKSINIKPKELIPNVRHWKNSIYTYNKNTLSLLPEANKLTIKIIKGYLNLYKLKLKIYRRKKRVLSNKRRKKNKKYLTSRIFINKGQFKHTNDLVKITLFIYNRQMLNYLSRLKNYIFRVLKKKYNKKSQLINKRRKKNKKLQEKIEINVNSYLLNINEKRLYNKNLSLKDKYEKIDLRRKDLSLKIFRLYLSLLELIHINKFKFNTLLIQGLNNLIKKIYRKNVQFNFIDLKYFYLNSDIFSQVFIVKYKQNRNKLKKHLKKIIKKTKINNTKSFKSNNLIKDLFKDLTLNNKLDTTNILLNDIILQNKKTSQYLKKNIFNDIKYKKISGIKLQVGGRITRRFTASRSTTFIKYKGSLSNINSTIYGYSSALLRGNLKSNLDYTKLNSKARIGSFGVKGWLSGI